MTGYVPDPLTIEFYLGITRCPDGTAAYATHLRNRGHDNWPEITCWPKQRNYRLTTGAESGRLSMPEPVLNETEKQICAILGLHESELGIFLREWTPLSASPLARLQHPEKNYNARENSEKPQTLEEIRAALWGAK